MEEQTNTFQEIIEKIKENPPEKTGPALNPKEVYRKLREYYYRVSHDDYYAAKRRLDDNVELKKHLREELAKLQLLKEIEILNNEQKAEVERINNLLEEQTKEVPVIEKITEMIKVIDDKLEELKAFVKNELDKN